MTDFKSSTIYQIYTKSFFDSNNDGIGDIRGIIAKLDYVKSLGVDYIWCTPFFASPLNDNGYDVTDYRKINPLFGTMADVEELIAKAAERDMGLMFDMVFNHTSTQHEWFQKALSGDKEYQAYYIFKDGEPDTPPTNWLSKFGGSAWEYVPALKKWYLHLFDITQADLNWDNPKVREELKKVICFWKDKGVRGFRFDVVNLISKPEQFEDDLTGDGRRFYSDGPHVHEYLQELVTDTGIGDMITVGEMSSTSLKHCLRYSNEAAQELSMCFNFHHLKIDYNNGNKWELQEPDYRQLKELFTVWQTEMAKQQGWNAVFWCNHDQPRIVSRLGDEGRYWDKSAKMLAACIHLLRGTPYIYQGEELGMTNPGYTDISDYRDVESINYYNILLKHGSSKEAALEVLQQRSRDNSRTPMQWNGDKYAGFSQSEPWIKLPDNYTRINAALQESAEDSVLNFYRRLTALRKQYRIIQTGSIEFLYQKQPQLFAYRRCLETQELLVLNNLNSAAAVLPEPIRCQNHKILLGNYQHTEPLTSLTELKPYESIVLFKAN